MAQGSLLHAAAARRPPESSDAPSLARGHERDAKHAAVAGPRVRDARLRNPIA
jgi:hypothetical protein